MHCSQGVSRSASLVIAYLMWRDDAEYEVTFRRVKAVRGIANPNMVLPASFLQPWRTEAPALKPCSLTGMTGVGTCRVSPASSYSGPSAGAWPRRQLGCFASCLTPPTTHGAWSPAMFHPLGWRRWTRVVRSSQLLLAGLFGCYFSSVHHGTSSRCSLFNPACSGRCIRSAPPWHYICMERVCCTG